MEEEALGAYNIWVTALTDDDLPTVLRYANPGHLIIGTGYGHQDQSSEIDAMRTLRDRGGLAPGLAERILGQNACEFYGIDVASPLAGPIGDRVAILSAVLSHGDAH